MGVFPKDENGGSPHPKGSYALLCVRASTSPAGKIPEGPSRYD